MKARVLLESAATSGGELTLYRPDRDFMLQIDREDLMSSRLHGSEDALAELALGQLPARKAARVLVGGLGMGFTLRATLDALEDRPGSRVVVAEIFEAIVRWNDTHLGPLAGHPTSDKRVEVRVEDVRSCLTAGREPWDAILLDVDNGPAALTLDSNSSLYSRQGLQRIFRALAPGGVLAVWSAHRDPQFTTRLRKSGFEASSNVVAARKGGKGSRHVIFLAKRD